MSDSLFQVAGVASGIGWDEIITKSIEAARRPATQWQNKIDSLEYKRTLYQEISSAIFKLRGTITPLSLPSAFKKKTAEWVVRAPAGSDASNIIKATPNANAEVAAWDIKVTQRAKAQQHISNKFDPAQSLGISGRVQIQVGMQVAWLEVEESDTIRTINQKLNSLTGPDGSPLAVKAKLIDNHLVIEGAMSGLDTDGPLGEVRVNMYDSLYEDVPDRGDPTKTVRQYKTYLPQPADGSSFPQQLYMVTSNEGTITYYEGRDFTYDNEKGIITWLGKHTGDTYPPKRPANGAAITAVIRAPLANRPPNDGDADFSGLIDADFSHISKLPTLPGGALYNNLPGGAYYPPTGPVPVNNVSNPFHPDYDPGNTTDYDPAMDNYLAHLASLRGTASDPNDPSYDPDPTTNPAYDPALTEYYEGMSDAYYLTSPSGVRYQCGKDYEFSYVENGSQRYQVIKWKRNPETAGAGTDNYTLFPGMSTDYIVNHRQLRLIEEDPTSENSVLARLGITTITEDPDTGEKSWAYTPGQFTEAQDAKLTLNGVEVTRFTNKIPDPDDNDDTDPDALIANVSLELLGEGDVTMNITQDAEKIMEDMQAFIDAYNEAMEIINFRLEEKYNSNTVNEEDDQLQNILKANRGTTTFGPLHGDQLLWGIKNQMRQYVASPVASMSNSLRSRKYLFTNTALTAQGSFYLNTGGMTARINISPTDTLEDIRIKIANATAINSKLPDGSTPSKKELGLDVRIENGQLVVAVPADKETPPDEIHTIIRDKDEREGAKGLRGENFDRLLFVPSMSPPVNGSITVFQGGTTFVEDIDFKLNTFEDENGILQSHIVWQENGQKPTPGTPYYLRYDYDPTAVSYTPIENTGDLRALDLHYDSSSVQLSTLGITTEQLNYGKSGLLEFDQEKFFEAIRDDTDMVSNVMLSFMRKMDTYIGNLVDSKNVVVGGTVVTKGRIAAALNSIDSEVNSLSEQITKLEKQLQSRQNEMYRQYSAMEQAIQKLNAQMSSLSQFFAQSQSK